MSSELAIVCNFEWVGRDNTEQQITAPAQSVQVVDKESVRCSFGLVAPAVTHAFNVLVEDSRDISGLTVNVLVLCGTEHHRHTYSGNIRHIRLDEKDGNKQFMLTGEFSCQIEHSIEPMAPVVKDFKLKGTMVEKVDAQPSA
jgi:hypothetical protein